MDRALLPCSRTAGARVRECLCVRTSVEVEAGLPDEEQALLFPALSELHLRFMTFLTVALRVKDNRHTFALAHFRRRLKAETLDGWDG